MKLILETKGIGQMRTQENRERRSKSARELFYFAAAGLLILLNIWILYRMTQLQEGSNLISVSYPTETVTEKAFEQMLETEESRMYSEAVVWKSAGKAMISAENTGREQKVSCYQMKGQPGAVFGKGLLSGRYFTEGETEVCLLDRNSARLLFGSEDVLGLEIQMGGNKYRIAGLLAESTSVCVIPAEENSEAVYDGVAVRKKTAGQSSKLAVNFLEVNLGSTAEKKIDGQLYYVTASLGYASVTAFLLVLAGCGGRRWMMGQNGGRAEGAVRRCIVPVSLTAAVFVLTAGIRFANPGSDYLPASWADFAFFGQLMKEKAEQIQGLVRYQEFSVWGNLLRNWQQAIGAEILLAAVGIIFFLQFMIWERDKQGYEI